MSSPQEIGTFTNVSVQDSNVLTKDDFGRCRSLEIACTSAALTGTNTLQSNHKQDGTGTWVTVQSPPGTDVTLAALKGVVIQAMPFMALRIHSSVANEGGTRVFVVTGEVGE